MQEHVGQFVLADPHGEKLLLDQVLQVPPHDPMGLCPDLALVLGAAGSAPATVPRPDLKEPARDGIRAGAQVHRHKLSKVRVMDREAHGGQYQSQYQMTPVLAVAGRRPGYRYRLCY